MRTIRVVWIAASLYRSLTARSKGLPVVQCRVLNPQRQAAAPTQPRLVFRPVLHLERHFRDVVTAIVVVFVRHQGVRTWEVNGILPPTRSVCTNVLFLRQRWRSDANSPQINAPATFPPKRSLRHRSRGEEAVAVHLAATGLRRCCAFIDTME